MKKDDKPYFSKRIFAFFIDILLVSIVVSCISLIIPKTDNSDKVMDEYKKIQVKLLDGEISNRDFINQVNDVVYDIDYSNIGYMIIECCALILYFIVFQFYNKGQSLGKKLMKLRITKVNDSELTINDIAIRSIIINSILINILVIGVLLFIGKNHYYIISSIIQFINIIIIFVTLVMILFRKDGRGLHDVLSNTIVIQER